jgi:transcriptional regulator with XRE-family HTH domain
MTQQEVAERLGLSRVAISQFEAGITVPSERTVILLAGLFKLEPLDLVAGTGYPMAKAERLPSVVLRHTDVELQLARCETDLEWLTRVDDADGRLQRRVADEWRDELAVLAKSATRQEAERIKQLRARLAESQLAALRTLAAQRVGTDAHSCQ